MLQALVGLGCSLLAIATLTESARIANFSCPYQYLNGISHVVVSDTNYCETLNVEKWWCYINATDCLEINATGYMGPRAVGSLLDYQKSSTSLELQDNGDGVLDLSMLELPDHLEVIAFVDVTKLPIAQSFKWPSKLQELNFTFASILPTSYPSTLRSLVFESSNATTLPPLSSLPKLEILWLTGNQYSNQIIKPLSGAKLDILSIATCNLDNLSDLDFSHLSYLYLGINPNLHRITNMKFSRNLTYLSMSELDIQHWVMDNATFNAVNALVPYYESTINITTSLYYNRTINTGYYYRDLSITSDASECAAANGTIQQLWADATNRKGDAKDKTFKVCVLSPPWTPEPEVQSSNTGLIVGIAIGAAVAVGVAVFFYTRRQTEKKFATTTLGGTYGNMPSTPFMVSDEVANALTDLTPHRLDAKSITFSKKLGSGAFADVWLAKYNDKQVAVKSLHGNQQNSRVILTFIDEITLMASFNCPHIVHFVGAIWSTPADLKCVMEYMDNGDLKEFLDANSPKKISWSTKYDQIYSIIQAIVYLHSMNIIHRDLKSRNVLLDTTKGTKITDFGISKEDIQATMTIGVGTFRWMAPEVIQDHEYTIAADIYSFGCILSEFDTHHVPYEDLKNPVTGQPITDPAIMVKVVSGSIKPSFTSSCPDWIRSMADECLAFQPEDRPSATSLAHTIQKALKNIT